MARMKRALEYMIDWFKMLIEAIVYPDGKDAYLRAQARARR